MTVVLPERIETRRLALREPRMADAQVIFDSYARDMDVARYTVWRPHVELAETESFLAACVAAWRAGHVHPYVLTLSGSEAEAIGMLEVRLEECKADVGYVLARRCWGQGLMPEALTAVVAHCLSMTAMFRVQATCDVDNKASARTLEKAGFTREARLERYTLHPNISAEPRPCYMYARCR